MQRTLSVASDALQGEIAAVQRHVALSAGAAGGHGVESQVRDAAQRLATNLLGELSSAAGNDGGLWLRVGLAMAGSVVAFAVVRRLGAREVQDRSKRWRDSERRALHELRFDREASQADAIPCSPILVSESQLALHRGYRVEEVDDVVKEMISHDVIGLDTQPVALCYDMDALKETLLALKEAFPPHFVHAIAIKSNPLPFFLRSAVELGLGLECASISEVVLALRQGCRPEMIMFDSPAKSRREIAFALRHNVQLNADNFFELDRIVEARARLQTEGVFSTSHVGVRVNPLVGLGAIKALSVSDVRSKFGIPLDAENRPRIIDRFREHVWLDSVHIHVGSQGCSMEQHASGAARLTSFVAEIEAAVGAGRIRVLDIGGGLPVNFGSAEVTPRYSDYSQILRHAAPALFTNSNRTIVTEYGRSVSAKAAWAVCAVEYVKKSGDGLDIAVIQAGADLFMRTCYCPSNFPLRVSAHNKCDGAALRVEGDMKEGPNDGHANGNGTEVCDGKLDYGPVRRQAHVTIAGPLCFGGDKVAEEMRLPELREGDFVVVHDAGANTLSTFSRHCSRTCPPVYGYYRPGVGSAGTSAVKPKLVLLKAAEPIEHVLSFWEDA